MTNNREKKLAKRLAVLFAEGGEETIGQIRPTLEKLLEGRSSAERKRFINTFHRFLVREIAKDTLTIESAQELANEAIEQIKQSFAKNHTRPLHVNTRSNPDLISGLRVRLGDTVYDASLSGKLDTLASNIH